MRKKLIKINERIIMQAIGGQLFAQAPKCQPRKAEIIMQKFQDLFREDVVNRTITNYYELAIEEKELNNYIHKKLMSIQEFRELNLSQIEYENNVDDENRSGYTIISAYDIETEDSWKDDFVDLDAFIRNVERNIYMIMDSDRDCFLCKYNEAETSSECDDCILNRKHEFKYEPSRNPKGIYTFACKYDCNYNYYIGCDECDKREECEYRCDHSCKDCELAINHVNK